jgi:glutathione S-transferase
MKLYYSPGACSLAPHIVAHELGLPLTLEKVDTKTKQTAGGADFTAINPKGYVPALQLDDGEVLTEGPVISQYLADLQPGAGLAPANGTLARYRLQEILGYINSEIHKSYSPLFNPATSAETREERLQYLRKRYGLIENRLKQSSFITGEQFTVADAYLFTVTNWARHVKLDLGDFPALQAYQQRIAARPAVQAAMQAEGLIKA